MKITDLSHTIHTHMPVYPGTEEPMIEYPFQIDSCGFNESHLSMVSHTGTHTDAPAHMFPNGNTLDRMRPESFFGKGKLLQVRGRELIDTDFIRSAIEDCSGIDFLLLYTGWSKFWGKTDYYEGYPVLSCEAAEYICSFPLKGIGIDTISFDKEGSTEFPVHKILLHKEILLI